MRQQRKAWPANDANGCEIRNVGGNRGFTEGSEGSEEEKGSSAKHANHAKSKAEADGGYTEARRWH